MKRYKQMFTESGFSRVAQIMLGLVPTVKTFGIMTAENPMGKKLSNLENDIRIKEFKQYLAKYHHGYSQPDKGKYGSIEHPVFIANITKNELLDLAVKYGQESVIYGETEGFGLSQYYYLETANKDIPSLTNNNYKTISIRKVFHTKDSAQDLYTQIKGKKFIIPFFDDKMKDAEFKNGYIIDSKTGKKLHYNSKEDTTEFLNEVEKEVLQRIMHILQESVTSKSRWENRGIINNILKYNYFTKE